MTISQAQAVQSAARLVAGSADSILQAAINADKARGKLAEQVRALFASPAPVVAATLAQAFETLEARLTTKKGTDCEAWGRIANSIATNVRIQWNGLPEDARPAVCYIALDRGAMAANVKILAKPSKAELKAALGHDTKAFNAARERLFGKPKQTSKAADDTAPQVVTSNEKHAPRTDAIGTIMEQLAPLSMADLHELNKRISAEIDRRTAAALEKAEKKGAGPTAAAKVGAKSRGEAQKKAAESAKAKAA